MKQILKFFLSNALYWLIMFYIFQICFLIFNINQLKDIENGEIFMSFIKAFPMQVTTMCYLMAIPSILYLIHLWTNEFKPQKGIKYFNFALIIITSLISAFDIGLYSVWRTKINAKAVSYLYFPEKTLANLQSGPWIPLLFIIIISIIIGFFLFNKNKHIWIENKINIFIKITLTLIIPFLLFTGIRGGWGRYPINKGWAFYSKHLVLNYSALNGTWNFFKILSTPEITKNPYQYMSDNEARTITESSHQTAKDSTIQILNTLRPNIVFIFLESFSADNSQKLGGENLAPGLDQLMNEGLTFDRCYATGYRTEQGLVAVLNSYPAQPQSTIMRNFGKFELLPSLMQTLDSVGYNTNYMCSCNEEFANTRAYLKTSQIDKIYGEQFFEKYKKCSQWGCYDECLFSSWLSECKNMKEPFSQMLFTITNHEPYDAVVPQHYPSDNSLNKFRNTSLYSDSCLFAGISAAKNTAWYKNTLFIILADHAQIYPKNRENYEPGRHHIPLVFMGGALKKEFQGKHIKYTTSQTDIASTLLHQMHIRKNTQLWSKNALNPYAPHFAFYAFDEGFGLVNDSISIAWEHNSKKVVYNSQTNNQKLTQQTVKQGQAFLQYMFQSFIKLNQ